MKPTVVMIKDHKASRKGALCELRTKRLLWLFEEELEGRAHGALRGGPGSGLGVGHQ